MNLPLLEVLRRDQISVSDTGTAEGALGLDGSDIGAMSFKVCFGKPEEFYESP